MSQNDYTHILVDLVMQYEDHILSTHRKLRGSLRDQSRQKFYKMGLRVSKSSVEILSDNSFTISQLAEWLIFLSNDKQANFDFKTISSIISTMKIMNEVQAGGMESDAASSISTCTLLELDNTVTFEAAPVSHSVDYAKQTSEETAAKPRRKILKKRYIFAAMVLLVLLNSSLTAFNVSVEVSRMRMLFNTMMANVRVYFNGGYGNGFNQMVQSQNSVMYRTFAKQLATFSEQRKNG